MSEKQEQSNQPVLTNEGHLESLAYTVPGEAVQIETMVGHGSIWLTQQQIAELFKVGVPAISKHLNNIFKEGELQPEEVVSILENTTQHGAIPERTQTHPVMVFNLDAIISVGYRVNSHNATQFRIWATKVLKDYVIYDGTDKGRILLRNELSKHNTKLAKTAKQAGVRDQKDFGVFHNHGYQGLYGGLKVRDIKQRKGLEKSESILDYMGSPELAANLFRVTQTDEKLRKDSIKGKSKANDTHFEVGEKVRKAIKDIGGTMPEDLPTPKKSIKALKKEQKKIEGSNKVAPNKDIGQISQKSKVHDE